MFSARQCVKLGVPKLAILINLCVFVGYGLFKLIVIIFFYLELGDCLKNSMLLRAPLRYMGETHFAVQWFCNFIKLSLQSS